MAGRKGCSGRWTASAEQKRRDTISKAWKIVDEILDSSENSPTKLQTAHDIVLKDITIKMEGKGFGDLRNIYAVINQIQQDFISKDSESSLVLDRGDGVDAGRARSEDTIQEISEQRIP